MWFERSGFGKGFIVGLINVRDDFSHGGKGFQRNFAVNVHRFQNLYQIGVPMDFYSLIQGNLDNFFGNLSLTLGQYRWRVMPGGVVTQSHRISWG